MDISTIPLPPNVILLSETVEHAGEWPVKLLVKDKEKNRIVGRFGKTRADAYRRVKDALNERFDGDEGGSR